ncbi:MFS transporter [Methylocella silvestris]|uniref:MFS transporter n=2 Tax=Methylocella silvestris TaxID=199596 RepID=A0A2J7TMH0_METSI|nr:MFS transporter [Methylocella silvestris]
MLVTAGAVGAPGVLIGPLQKEFGWATADISTALAVRLMLFGLMGPFAAAFMNRFGLRRVAAAALTLIALGVLGSFMMTKLWHLLLFWGVMVGFGTGLTAMVFAATVATRWFSARRGLVLGLLTASAATGQLAFLPLLAELTETIGWRGALVFVLAALLLAALAALTLLRDWPADVGLAPFGATAIVPPPAEPASLGAMLASPLLVLREAARSHTFWVLFGAFFVCGASTNGLVQTHFISLCGDYGMAAVTAASVLAMIGVFDFAGTVGSGWLSDRYDSRWLLFWYYGLRGLSLLYLPFTDFTFYGLSLFAVFYGLDWVATVPPTIKLAADRFGDKANLVFGWIFAGHQLGAASAAYGAGFSRTAYASYLPAFFVAGALCLIASAFVLTLRDARLPMRARAVA